MLCPQCSDHDLLECSDAERDGLVAVVDDIFGRTNCRRTHLALGVKQPLRIKYGESATIRVGTRDYPLKPKSRQKTRGGR